MKKRMFLNTNFRSRFTVDRKLARHARKLYNYIMNSEFCLTPFMKQPEESLIEGLIWPDKDHIK